ncbi:hypothetical protein ACWCL1_04920 [Ligilactobacillus sp. LYQ135]
MKKLMIYLLDGMPLILLVIGIVLISLGAFSIGKVVGLVTTGIMLIAVSLIFAYQKGDER